MYAKISNSMRFPALLAFVHLLISTWCYVEAFVSISERQTPKFELRSSTQDEPARLRKRDRLLQVLKIQNKPRKEEVKYPIYTESDLEEYWEDKEERFRTSSGEIDHAAMLKSLDVRGDTQQIGSADHKDYVHPVQRLLHERRRGKSVNGTKIALAVEGGGMRGCISAGMVCAIHHLNLTSSFDAVYGSSAGTVVGAYLITGQLPWFGPEVYYDRLTTAGRDFIDTRRLLRAIGFGLLDPRLYKDVLTRPQGKPVLNLSFLFKNTVQETKPLDWDSLVAKSDKLPLYVVASDVKNERSITLNMKDGHFCTLEELANCMLASCLLPGIAGPLMNMNVDSQDSKFLIQNGVEDEGYISMADALIYEPLPYRSALDQGATHVVVLRSRPVRFYTHCVGRLTGVTAGWRRCDWEKQPVRKANIQTLLSQEELTDEHLSKNAATAAQKAIRDRYIENEQVGR